MRRIHPRTLAALTGILLFAAAALGRGPIPTPTAAAIAADGVITLNPAAPQAGSAFTASADDCSGLEFPPYAVNILTEVTVGGVFSGSTDGPWSVAFPTTWNDGLGAGWYAVAAECDEGDWASSTFFIAGDTPVEPITIHLGGPGPNEEEDYFASGTGCSPGDHVQFRDITDDLVGGGGTVPVESDGSWSTNLGSYDQPNRHDIAACVSEDGVVGQLFEYGGTPTAPPTSETPTTVPGTPTTVPKNSPAPAASAVVAQPTFTG